MQPTDNRPSKPEVISRSETLGELFGALAKAQGAMLAAEKDRENPFFKSKYADLASVWQACRAPLSGNGLCVLQPPVDGGGGQISVVTIIGHESGEWIGTRCTQKIDKDLNPQETGKAITYLRRYALSGTVGITQDDDDGESAREAAERAKRQPKQQQEKHKPQDEPPPLTVAEREAVDSLRAAIQRCLTEEEITEVAGQVKAAGAIIASHVRENGRQRRLVIEDLAKDASRLKYAQDARAVAETCETLEQLEQAHGYLDGKDETVRKALAPIFDTKQRDLEKQEIGS